MKNLCNTALTAFLGLFLIASCKNNTTLNDSMTAIPKDATSVTAINISSLMQKADFEAVKNMDFYKETVVETEKDNPTLAEILKDPKKSGIDLTKNFYFVQEYNMLENGGGSGQGIMLMSIADVKAFEAMLQNAKAGEVQTKDGIKFIVMDKEQEETTEEGYKVNYKNKGTVAWNDKMAVLGSDTEGMGIFSFFKTKPEESMAQNSHMKDLMGKTHDFYTFGTFDKYADNMSAKAAAGAMNLDPKALKGNYFTGFADFEKGQIVSKSDFKINKHITKEWGLLLKDNVKTDFSKYMNGQNMGFAMTLALDMKGLKEIINANPQFRMMTKSSESALNFSVDDLCKALDGDIVISAVPNFDAKDDKWSGMMGFKISDKPTIQRLMDALVKEEVLVKENDNNYRFSGIADEMSKSYIDKNKITIINDVLFVGDYNTVSSLTDKGSVSGDIKDVLNKNIFGMYVNFEKVFAQSEDMKNPEITEMKMMFNAKSGENIIKVRDQNENSLKSLIKMANKWYLKNKVEKEKAKNEETPAASKDAI